MAIYPSWLNQPAVRTLACLLCLQSCTASHQGRQASTAVPEELPPAVELTQTPFFPQTEHQCGPAALATVLQFYDLDVLPEQLIPLLYIPEREGSLQIEMAAAARSFGMLPYPLEPRLGDLLTEVAAGNPVLVMQNLGFGWWPQWHYAVVIGYDVAASQIILRSGTTERWQSPFETFAKTWERAEHWALAIVPAGTIPATARVSSYLGTAYTLEETGLNQHAIEAYRGATLRWSSNVTAWLALGNLAYQTGDTTAAIGALYTAARIDPDQSRIWNNLAYALYQGGCKEQAMESLKCAKRLSPEDQNIRDSEQEIKNMTVQRVANHCPEIACI